jgi:threonine dehydrogenase-like Zn-dependent dehydrogenase
MPLQSACPIRVSFPIAMVRGSLTPWAKEYHRNGSDGVCRVTGLNLTVLLALPPNIPVVPLEQVVPLPETVPVGQGAYLGIPGMTAHRAVHVAGPVGGRTLLVQGGAGAVGACAVQLAHRAGARVIAPLAVLKAISKSFGVRVQIRSC